MRANPPRQFRAARLALAGALFLAACAAPAPATPSPEPGPYPGPAASPTTAATAAPQASAPPTTTTAPTLPAATATEAPLAAASATPAAGLFLPFVGQAPPTATAEAPAALPTATPPPWPEALSGPTASKLGLHAMGSSDPYVMEFIRRVQPRVIKAVGDFGWLAEAKAAAPQAVTIGRVLAEQSEWILTVDPAVAGRAYVEINLAAYQANPAVDYWEGWNEYAPGTPERMRWFAEFEAARACEMQARGWRAAVGGFSTGVPEYARMADFLPALEAAARCGGLFHLHEYNSPTFECGVGVNIPELIPGAPAVGAPAGPLALRYRFWYEAVLKPRGLGGLPLVISELGIDGVAPSAACDDPGGLGWKPYSDWWPARGFGHDGPSGYVAALGWYDAEMRRDPYVLGATLFTANALNPGDEWHAFDLHDVLVPLAVYAASQR